MMTNEARQSQLTEKRRVDAAEMKKKDLRRHLLKLQEDGDELLKTDSDHAAPEETESVLENIRQWKHQHLTCLQIQEDIKSLLSVEELEEHTRTYEEVLTEVNIVRAQLEAVERKMAVTRHEKTQANRELRGNPEDGRSAVSVGSTTSSVRARLLEKKIDDERQQAKATVELAALRRRRELERRQQDLQWELEELELQTQIEASKVQSEVTARHEATLDAIEEMNRSDGVNAFQPSKYADDRQILADEDQHRRNTRNETRQSMDSVHHRTASAPLESVEQHQTKPADRSVTEILASLSQLLTEQLSRSRLPALEPKVFTGEIEEFCAWLTSFECYIEARTESPVERLHYLSVYTGGDAHRAIQGLLLLRNDNAYEQAKQKLRDRYGNDFLTANAYKQRLRSWPAIRPGDGKALLELADFLDCCQAAAQLNSGLQSLGDPHEVSQLLKKLPKYIFDRWKRVVDERIYEPRAGVKSGYPSFPELVSFIKKEARVESGPVDMQLDRQSQLNDRPFRRNADRNRAVAFASSSTAPRPERRSGAREHGTSSSESFAKECILCSEKHPIRNCPRFADMTPVERHEIVEEFRLCRGCLCSGHFWRKCRSKATCSKCARQHPTLLHVDDWDH